MIRTITVLVLAGAALGAGCLSEPDDPVDLLPDGSTGVTRVRMGGELVDLPYEVRDGRLFIDEDLAIGPALAHATEAWSAAGVNLRPWVGDRVDYCVRAGVDDGLSPDEEAVVDGALDDLELITPIKFWKASSCSVLEAGAAPFIDFIHWDKGADFTSRREITDDGQQGGNTIKLGKTWHFAEAEAGPVIQHETGHALGFLHEARRSDRNFWVNFYPECLPDAVDGVVPHTTPFAQLPATGDRLLTPYDVTSIMEYPSFNFSRNKNLCPTLLYDPDPDGVQDNDDDHHAPCFPVMCAPQTPCVPIRCAIGNHVRHWGTEIVEHTGYSREDVNGVYQAYEPRLEDPQGDDRYGTRLARGDFDDDGYDDLAVSAIAGRPGASVADSGMVLVYKGTMNGLVAWKRLRENDFAAPERPGDQFGFALAAGDVDGDGVDDLIVGAPHAGPARGGTVFPYLGGTRGLTPSPAGAFSQRDIPGAGTSTTHDDFGAALAMGRFLDDTRTYIAVGAPGERFNGTGRRGVVQLFRWNWFDKVTHAGSLFGDQATPGHDGDGFGLALASAHLYPLRAADDLLVGAPQLGGGPGMVIPFYGHATAMQAGVPLAHPDGAPGDDFGLVITVARTGAHTSIAVGAPGRDGGVGGVYVYDTTTGAGTVVVASLIEGQVGAAGDGFGSAIAIGDLDGDGDGELVVGAPGKRQGDQIGAGAVYLFMTAGPPRVMRAVTPQSSDVFGSAIATGNWNAGRKSAAGDANGDLAIGMPGRTVAGQSSAGAVNSYRGTALSTVWRHLTADVTGGPP